MNPKYILKRQRSDKLKAIPMVAGILLTAPLIHSDKIPYGENARQYYLYFAPKEPVQNTVVVYLHPGGWSSYSPGEFEFICKRFSDRGYPTVSIGYRHAPEFKYPAQAEDVFAGFCAAMEFLAQQGFLTDRVAVVGSSAGGHLGGILAFNEELQRKYNVDPSCFLGLASLGGLMTYDCAYPKATQKLFDYLFEKDYDRGQAFPIHMINAHQSVRVLCIHSELDPISNIENQRMFVEQMNSLREGSATLLAVQDRNSLHCNLVAGIFFEREDASPPLRHLFSWLHKL